MRKFIFLSVKKIFKPFLGKGLSKYIPTSLIRLIYRVSFSKIQPSVAKVGNNKMVIDSMEAFRLALNEQDVREKLETDFFKKEIKKGMTVLDLGANMGFYTLLFAELVGGKGKVFAFEPEPNNFSTLEKNVRLNEYKNVELVKKAVSDKAGETKLHLSKSMGRHRIDVPNDAGRSVTIKTVILDDFLKGQKIDLIKMDIEGAEYMALKGMKDLLQRNKNIKIVTEFMPQALSVFGVKPEEYLRFLMSHGFILYHINEKKKKIVPATVAEIMEICEELKYVNIMCKRPVKDGMR